MYYIINVAPFQFHIGMINPLKNEFFNYEKNQFQFHIGMINPGLKKWSVSTVKKYFNSTLVWLIPCLPMK